MTPPPVRHALLSADAERGLERRNLAKPVHDRRVVDDMESATGWAATDVVTLVYTTERARTGTRSLRFGTDLRNDEYIRWARRENGSFTAAGVLFDRMPFAASAWREFSPAQDWSGFNRLSLWCYVHPVDPSVTQTNQLCLGFLSDGADAGPVDPVALHYVGGLLPGVWNHVVWEFPEMRRDQVSRLQIFQPACGVGVRGVDRRITYDFDDLSVERVDAEPVDGWAVTPGKIAYCHLGYQTGAEKVAVAPDDAEDFQLINVATGATVVSLTAERVVNGRGSYRLLDFSSFDQAGQYSLRHGQADTEPFPIGDDAWKPLVEATLNAFYGLRCGIEIPGVHDACHLDVFVEQNGERRVVGGGWHDAANLTQAPNRTFLSVYALLELHASLVARGADALAERVLEEARWGLDWLLATRLGPGLRALYGDYSYYTDGVVGTDDDVVQDGDGRVGRDPWLDTLSALASARAARTLRDADPDFSAALLRVAEEDYAEVAVTLTPPADAPPRQINEPCWRDQIGYLTLTAVELYRMTNAQRHADDAVRFAQWLSDTQERGFVDGIPLTGYFYEDAGRTRIVHEYHNSFEDSGPLAFAALCEVFHDHPDREDWRAGLVLYADHFCVPGAAASAPFSVLPAAVWRRADLDAPMPHDHLGDALAAAGPSAHFPTAPTPELVRHQMLEQFEAGLDLGADHRLRVFPLWYDNTRHGSTNVQLAKAISLGAAASTLGRPDLMALVGRQLQWLLGLNPFSRSLFYGVGYDFWPNFSVSLPNLVGGLSVGMNSLRNDSPAWGNNAVFPYKEQWVFASCRVAHTLAYLLRPARERSAIDD